MPLLAIGLNHHTAEVSIRERFAVASNRVVDILQRLQKTGIDEAVLLSTCNRTELYCVAERSDAIIETLCLIFRVDVRKLDNIWYIHHDHAALRHLVLVAAGLDSMILGEPQILGQVKKAYEQAKSANTVGKILHRIFQQCFFLTKKIRSETNIGKNPVSIAFAASTLAKHIFADPAQCKVLLVGAGETIALTARHFQRQGVTQFYFVNRTLEHAMHLATQFQASLFELSELAQPLAQADIIVTATGSCNYLITYNLLINTAEQMASRPILLLDLSVPRNIDPSIGKLPDCYLYGIDDLQSVVLDNFEKRRDAAALAKEMIYNEVEQFFYKQKSSETCEKIADFTEQITELVATFEKNLAGLQSVDEVVMVAKKCIKKMQHQTLKFLQQKK